MLIVLIKKKKKDSRKNFAVPLKNWENERKETRDKYLGPVG